jgi:hypothetical protein
MRHSIGLVVTTALLATACNDGQCEAWGVATLIHDSHRSSAEAILGFDDGMMMGGSPTAQSLTRLDHYARTRWSVEPGLGEIKDVIEAPDGGFVITASGGSGLHDSGKALWVGRVSPDGELTWQTMLGAAHYMAWMKANVLAHPEGGYVVSWYDSGDEGADTRLRLARIDELGASSWALDHPSASGYREPNHGMQGGMGVLPDGDILQLTTEGDDLRLVRTGADGRLVSDIVVPVAASPADLLVLPDGSVLALANSPIEAMLLEIEPEDGWISMSHTLSLGEDRFLHSVQWDPLHELLYLGGTAHAAGRSRPWTLVIDRDGSEIASVIDEELTVGGPLDVSARSTGGFAVVRHGGASLHLETALPCDEL